MSIIKTISDFSSADATNSMLLFFAMFVATFFALAESDPEVSIMLKRYSLGVVIASLCMIGMLLTLSLLILGQVFRLLNSIPFLTSKPIIDVSASAIVIIAYIFVAYWVKTKLTKYIASREKREIKDDTTILKDDIGRLEHTIEKYLVSLERDRKKRERYFVKLLKIVERKYESN